MKELEKSAWTERGITIDDKDKKYRTIVKKAILPRDLLELTKIVGAYNPTLTIKHTATEAESEKKVCEDLLKKIKESET